MRVVVEGDDRITRKQEDAHRVALAQGGRTRIVQGWPKLWAKLQGSNRGFQSNCWAKSRNLGQPFTIFVWGGYADPRSLHAHAMRGGGVGSLSPGAHSLRCVEMFRESAFRWLPYADSGLPASTAGPKTPFLKDCFLTLA